MLLALMHGSATLELMIFLLIFFEELKSQQEFWKDVTFLVVLIFFFQFQASINFYSNCDLPYPYLFFLGK